MKRHVVLVGLPGSGKTVVGRLAAAQLGAKFVDVDQVIEQAQGLPVRDIFASQGESGFRVLESAAVQSALTEAPQVVSPGGGWAAQPGNLDALAGRAIAVWLVVDPAIAVKRTRAATTRPLLDGPDPLDRMQTLLAGRLAHYQRADVSVDTTDLTPELAARGVAQLARNLAGW